MAAKKKRRRKNTAKTISIAVPKHVNVETPIQIAHLLEQTSREALVEAGDRTRAVIECVWRDYSELAQQRHKIEDSLQRTLLEASRPFSFQHWQRAVHYKYSLHPLCTVGSTLSVGGRFNIGRQVNPNVPHFSGLYIAADRNTAIQEALQIPDAGKDGLSASELALANPASIAVLATTGVVSEVIDLIDGADCLTGFTELIRSFQYSKGLLREKARLGLYSWPPLTTSAQLLESLLAPEWRTMPTLYDVPANPQIFGSIARKAGVAGIRYPSRMTGQECLVLYPSNFAGTDSFVELDGSAPDVYPAVPARIDASNHDVCDLTRETLEVLGRRP